MAGSSLKSVIRPVRLFVRLNYLPKVLWPTNISSGLGFRHIVCPQHLTMGPAWLGWATYSRVLILVFLIRWAPRKIVRDIRRANVMQLSFLLHTHSHSGYVLARTLAWGSSWTVYPPLGPLHLWFLGLAMCVYLAPTKGLVCARHFHPQSQRWPKFTWVSDLLGFSSCYSYSYSLWLSTLSVFCFCLPCKRQPPMSGQKQQSYKDWLGVFICLFLQYWGLISGPCTCLAGTPPLVSCPQPFFFLLFFW